MTDSKKFIHTIGIVLLVIILGALAMFVFASAFFPDLLPSVDKYPSMDPTYDISE